MISVSQIAVSFGDFRAVHSVSFEARDGEITGLLGPNGAGKTTTLRTLYGMITPNAGRVLVDGLDIQASPDQARRRLGILPDARGLYARLTCRENIEYFGQLHGIRGAELEARVNRMIEVLELGPIADRRTEGFSQGQRVKTALGRALVHDPQNLILDEPTNGLDVMSTRALRVFLQRQRDQGRCIILSSHVMQEIAALCDRIVVIANGRVVADGTAEGLRHRTGRQNLEDAFVEVIGSDEGLMA